MRCERPAGVLGFANVETGGATMHIIAGFIARFNRHCVGLIMGVAVYKGSQPVTPSAWRGGGTV